MAMGISFPAIAFGGDDTNAHADERSLCTTNYSSWKNWMRGSKDTRVVDSGGMTFLLSDPEPLDRKASRGFLAWFKNPHFLVRYNRVEQRGVTPLEEFRKLLLEHVQRNSEFYDSAIGSDIEDLLKAIRAARDHRELIELFRNEM